MINFLKTTDFSTANVCKTSVWGEEIHFIRRYSHDTSKSVHWVNLLSNRSKNPGIKSTASFVIVCFY